MNDIAWKWNQDVVKACRTGSLVDLQRLITRENVNTQLTLPWSDCKATPLETCSSFKYSACIPWLVEEMGASFGTSLHIAVGYPQCTGVVAYLLSKGADVHQTLRYVPMLHNAHTSAITEQLLHVLMPLTTRVILLLQSFARF